MTSLAERDLKIDILRKVLKESLEYMNSKSDNIQTISQDNEFLIDVAKDYHTYNSIIKQQKIKQMELFETLNQYISTITDTMSKTDNILKQSENQKYQIMKEIKSLKKEINDII